MKLIEGDLEFDFDNDYWSQVIKFDVHVDYRKVTEKIPGTKGVDFTGILGQDTFVVIEVKDFRGSRIENKQRDEPLDLEVSKKFIGTLATIIGGNRTSTHGRNMWKDYLNLIRAPTEEIKVILWLEEDSSNQPANKNLNLTKSHQSILNDSLRKRLVAFNCKTLVTNHKNYDANNLHLKVKNISPDPV